MNVSPMSRLRPVIGKPFIGNPDLVDRLKGNLPLFEAPQSAYFGGDAEGYAQFSERAAA